MFSFQSLLIAGERFPPLMKLLTHILFFVHSCLNTWLILSCEIFTYVRNASTIISHFAQFQWIHELICSRFLSVIHPVLSELRGFLGRLGTFQRFQVLSLLSAPADNHLLVRLNVRMHRVWSICTSAHVFAHFSFTFPTPHNVHSWLCYECVLFRPVCVSYPTLSSWNTKQISSMW